MIGTVVAVNAIFHPLHLFLRLLRQEIPRRGTAKKQSHARRGGDIDPGGTGQAITAAAAEVACEFLSVALNHSGKLRRQDRGIFDVGEELAELALALHAPNRQHILILRKGGVRCGGVRDKAA